MSYINCVKRANCLTKLNLKRSICSRCPIFQIRPIYPTRLICLLCMIYIESFVSQHKFVVIIHNKNKPNKYVNVYTFLLTSLKTHPHPSIYLNLLPWYTLCTCASDWPCQPNHSMFLCWYFKLHSNITESTRQTTRTVQIIGYFRQ